MSKITYLNSHLDKFREKTKITVDIDNIGDLAHYSNLYKEDKKTVKQTHAHKKNNLLFLVLFPLSFLITLLVN